MASGDKSAITAYNIQLKTIHKLGVKTLNVLKAILLKIRDEKEPFTSACFKKIEGLEDEDSFEEIFQRRMGLRRYLKNLKVSLY